MKLRLHCLCVLGLLCPVLAPGQATRSDTLRHLIDLPGQARLATADHLGQGYVVRPDNTLEKYTADGRLLARYSSNRLGQVGTLDVSNPMKVLVWYPDFRTALLLDRNLVVLGEVSLLPLGFPDVRQVATASDGNLWAYDEVNFLLLKISAEGEKRAESQSLSLLNHTPRQVLLLREQDNRVWLADSTGTWMVFNAFGQYESSRRLVQAPEGAQVLGDQVFFLTDSSIVAERWPLPAHTEWPLPRGCRVFPKWLGGRRLFVRKEEGLAVYGF